MKKMYNAADSELWKDVCPVCGISNKRALKCGEAVHDLTNDTFEFMTTQPLYYVECCNCGHISEPSTSLAVAQWSWLIDVEQEEKDFWELIKK